MKFITSMDSGDLGRAGYLTDPGVIRQLIRHTSEIFTGLKHLVERSNMLCYCIEVSPGYGRLLEQIINNMEATFQINSCHFYRVDGRNVFEVRTEQGSRPSAICCYLICPGEKN